MLKIIFFCVFRSRFPLGSTKKNESCHVWWEMNGAVENVYIAETFPKGSHFASARRFKGEEERKRKHG